MGRLCYPILPRPKRRGQALGRVLVSRLRRDHQAVTVQGGYGVVFAVRVKDFWALRVSRYKVDRKQVTSQGTQGLMAETGAVAV